MSGFVRVALEIGERVKLTEHEGTLHIGEIAYRGQDGIRMKNVGRRKALFIPWESISTLEVYDGGGVWSDVDIKPFTSPHVGGETE